MFRALSVRNYRLYASGQVVSNTGTWMARVTQDWLVYHILTHDNSFALGVVTALQFLPALAFGMYGGMLGDRYPKRVVLTITQSAMAVMSLLSGIMIATHTMRLSTICVIALLFGIASALDMPVRQAFVIEMVGRDVLQNAVSLNSAAFNVSRMIGPAIAGVLIEAFGAAPGFFLNGVSYVAVITSMFAMTKADLHTAPLVARTRGQLREALSYVRNRPDLLLPVMLMGFIGTFGFNFQITNALIAQGVFHRGAGSYGLLSTAQAVGSLVGALIAARRRQRPRARLLIIAALVFSMLVAVSGFAPSYLLFMLLLLPIGGAGILLATSCNSMLQLGAAPEIQGRVMALYTTVFVGCAPFGSLLVGWLGGVFDPRWALFAGGVICFVSVVGCALYYVRAQHLEIRVADRVWWPRTIDDEELEDEALLADVRSR
ncbi:MAG TPA: MFS transporter [Acidothermaceae bacterium]